MIGHDTKPREKELLDVLVVQSGQLAPHNVLPRVGVADLVGVGGEAVAEGGEADAGHGLLHPEIPHQPAEAVGHAVLRRHLLAPLHDADPQVPVLGAEDVWVVGAFRQDDAERLLRLRPQGNGAGDVGLGAAVADDAGLHVDGVSGEVGAVGAAEAAVEPEQDHRPHLRLGVLEQLPHLIGGEQAVLLLGPHPAGGHLAEGHADVDGGDPSRRRGVAEPRQDVGAGAVEGVGSELVLPHLLGEAREVIGAELAGGRVPADEQHEAFGVGAVVVPTAGGERPRLHVSLPLHQVAVADLAYRDDGGGFDNSRRASRVAGLGGGEIFIERPLPVPPAAVVVDHAADALAESPVRPWRKWVGGVRFTGGKASGHTPESVPAHGPDDNRGVVSESCHPTTGSVAQRLEQGTHNRVRFRPTPQNHAENAVSHPSIARTVPEQSTGELSGVVRPSGPPTDDAAWAAWGFALGLIPDGFLPLPSPSPAGTGVAL